LCIAKSLNMRKAALHCGGLTSWQEDVSREVAALKCVAGVPGVVGLREVVTEPNGAVHLILECAP
jgi:hypothetical protein